MGGDLHCHTRMSDGSTSIEELIQMARRRGLSAIALTDHDTQAGNTRARIIGERQGVRVIPGIELSAYDYARGRKVHLLGYQCEFPDRLEGMCKLIADRRTKAHQAAAREIIRRYPITAEMIMRRAQGSTNIYKQHIMHTLIDAGCCDSFFGELFDQLFGPEGLAQTYIKYPDVFEVLSLIGDAGGVAVLAHPAQYDSFELLPELIDKGLQGVEIWHPRHTMEDVMHLQKVAMEHDLIMIGGTDFHGMYSAKPYMIGSYVTPEDQLARLLDHKTKRG